MVPLVIMSILRLSPKALSTSQQFLCQLLQGFLKDLSMGQLLELPMFSLKVNLP
jgi:hypothetical protein